ncbi:restriction endonuclease [Rhodococcus opacus]|uniref:restriction endonuclease n=1 Tax=Rhodococcus opacus TaxID=37919 RepID=UPI001FF620F7|nr:restriction endonuclease [Rhodococcus opacus]UOT06786.1 restriction endonuclease [Rhodococcus opacus]
MKKIATPAYEALRDALPRITWNKGAFESFTRTALRDSPELLAGLNFKLPKREVGDLLVNRLATDEDRYQQVTLTLMVEVASMVQFPNIAQMKDPADRAQRLEEAQAAVAHLRSFVEQYRDAVEARDRSEVEREARNAQLADIARFADDIHGLKGQYLALHGSADPHGRGKAFEQLLTDLFLLFDMEPRLSYSLANEQIDGSLSFDTDDYIVEAKWHAEPTGRDQLDIFAKKVERKGRNSQGIFVSEKGFTGPAIATYSESSPFVVFNGDDLYLVLEGRIRLDDLLRSKKRHLNETGNCQLLARDMLNLR